VSVSLLAEASRIGGLFGHGHLPAIVSGFRNSYESSARAARTRAARPRTAAPVEGPPVPLSRVSLDAVLVWFGEDEPGVLARARQLGGEARQFDRDSRHARMGKRAGTADSLAAHAAARRAAALDLLDGDA
jgi:hypothetical protein